MRKVTLETAAFVVPAPVILLSCVGADGSANIMGLAWAGVACATPPMVSVAIRPGEGFLHHGHHLRVGKPGANLDLKAGQVRQRLGNDSFQARTILSVSVDDEDPPEPLAIETGEDIQDHSLESGGLEA